MNKFLVFGFILFTAHLSKFSVEANGYGCTKESQLKTAALQNHLLCDYDPNIRPSNSGPTMVVLKLAPKFIEFLDTSHDLVLHSWLSMSWSDDHLSWDSNSGQFSGIHSLHISSSYLWTPPITVYNVGEMTNDMGDLPTTMCTVSDRKTVDCVAGVHYTARCISNYQHWPFDRQNCTIHLGSWSYSKDEVDFTVKAIGLDMMNYTESHEWKILSAKVTKAMVKSAGFVDERPAIFINFVLERYAAHKQATVTVPAILMIIMTITVLWLDPMSVERMMTASLNLICHLLCIMDLDWQVPFNGNILPSILVFHKNSLIIAGVAFFLTVFLRQLKEISIPPPVWMSSVSSMLLGSKTGQFVLLTTLDPKASATLGTVEEDAAGLVKPNSSFLPQVNPANFTTWHHLATLIDRLSFTGIILTYAIMLIVLIPKTDLIDP